MGAAALGGAAGRLGGAGGGGGALANLRINITGSANQFNLVLGATNNGLMQFGKQAGQATANAKNGFNSFLGTVSQANAKIHALVAAAAGMVVFSKAADSMDAAMKRLARTFGTGADEMVRKIDMLGTAFMAPRSAVIDMVATAGRELMGLGISAQEAGKMAEAMLKRSQDIAADGTMTQAEAFNALIDAVKGGGRALNAVGAQFTEAELHAKAVELGFVRAGRVMTEAEKAFVRYAVALDSTKNVEGAAGERADSFAASITRLQAALTELGEELGVTLIPALTMLAETLTWIVRVAKQATAAFREFVRDAGLVIAAPFVGIDAGELIAGRQMLEKEKADEEAKRKRAVDRRNLDRNAKLKADQENLLNYRGAQRTSLGEFAKDLQAAGFKQRAIGERQLDVLKRIEGGIQNLNQKQGKPVPPNPKAAGGA